MLSSMWIPALCRAERQNEKQLLTLLLPILHISQVQNNNNISKFFEAYHVSIHLKSLAECCQIKNNMPEFVCF